MVDAKSLVQTMFYVLLYWFVVNFSFNANPVIVLGMALIGLFCIARFLLVFFSFELKDVKKVFLQNYDFAFFGVIGLLAGISFTYGNSQFFVFLKEYVLMSSSVLFLFYLARMVFVFNLLKPFQEKKPVRTVLESAS